MLTREQLAHSFFPLGADASKAEVRAEAEARGFVTASKPDSYDICFIPDGDTRGWLDEKLGLESGEIVDRDGDVLGRHDGALAFTVGQRRGLSLTVPAPDGRPRFVLEVRPSSNEVVVGPREALAIGELAGARWSELGDLVTATEVQVRAHAEPVGCVVERADGEIRIRLDTPVEGVAPGQSAVLYRGTRVLGQVTIDRTVAAELATT